MLIDARLDNDKHELYETRAGGESWELKQASTDPIRCPANAKAEAPGWRLRADAATHSYVVERSEGERWQRVASFLVEAGVCKL